MTEATATPSPAATPEGPLRMLGRQAWQTVLLGGVIALAVGVMILIWPEETLFIAGVVFGLYLVISGILQVIAAFGTHTSTALRVLAFISGVICIVLGLFCFRDELRSLLLLALWIGIGWLFRGIAQTVAAASDDTMPARGWQIFLGVVTALAGVVVIVSPFDSLAVLTVFTAWMLIALGVLEIVMSFQLRRTVKDIPREL